MANNTEIIIAVMGATGTGKSSFVNLVSGSNFATGDGPLSCTPAVQATAPFHRLGRLVTLIDTPGFDDSLKTDSEILTMISSYLAQSYRDNKRLSGIIYMHRITDNRMGGVSKQNFHMLRKLCGDASLKNLAIVTNMWGGVTPEIGNERETQLASSPLFFKPALDKGAKIFRHHNTLDSAHDILRTFLDKFPVTLQVQHEIVNESKGVAQTAAGAEIEARKLQEREAQRLRQEEEARKARELAEQQRREQAAQKQKEIEAARVALEAKLAREREERAREAARLAELKRQEEIRLAAVQQQLAEEAEARRRQEEEAERLRRVQEEQARRHQEEMERLRVERERREQENRRQSDWVRNRDKVRRTLRRIF